MTTDLNLSELDALIAKYDDPRGPDHVQLDRMVTSELLPIWPALRERLAAAEADRAELLEWRRRAAEEVRADMRADSDLANALWEARAELEKTRVALGETELSRREQAAELERLRRVEQAAEAYRAAERRHDAAASDHYAIGLDAALRGET